MLHKISNLNGVKSLAKTQQKSINGGGPRYSCQSENDCGRFGVCIGGACIYTEI